MDKLPSSFIGYNKQAVDNLLNQKNQLLKTQQKDIDYLRQENTKLKSRLKPKHPSEPEPEA